MGDLARLSFKKETLCQFLYNLKKNFLYIVLIGEGLSDSFFFFFFFLWMLLKKDFEGLIDVFPL